jgi:hypothetical protein
VGVGLDEPGLVDDRGRGGDADRFGGAGDVDDDAGPDPAGTE